MSGYRPGYSEAHSPTYDTGRRDGGDDNTRISNCPPAEPAGKRQQGAMYGRGYDSMFDPGMRHVCGPGCPQFKARERAEKDARERQNS